jgi:PAS domain S-box-containing protein
MDAENRAEDSSRLLRLQRDLAIALSSASEVESVGRLVLAASMAIPGIDGGGLYVVEAGTGALDLVAHAGLDPAFIRLVSHYPADSAQARIVMSGDAVAMPYADLCPTPDPVLAGEGLAATLVQPIRHEGAVIACLNLMSRRQVALSGEARAALGTLATYSASAIARVQAQEALAETRRNLECLFSTLADLLFVVDTEGRIVHVNPAVERRMGVPAAQMVGLHTLELYAPQHRDEAAQVLGQMWAGERTTCTIPLQARDGSFVPMELRISRGRWDDREAMFGISRDVSESARAEAAVRETEERFRVIAEMSSDFIYGARAREDGALHLEWVVGAFQPITGYAVDEVNALPGAWSALVHEQDLDAVRLRHGVRVEGGASPLEYRITTRDGRIRWLRDAFRFEPDDAGGGGRLLGAVSDITEARRLEDNLRQVQKMEGIGRLAGGVAHDFNNLLQPILGYSELLSLSLPADQPDRGRVEVIREAATRARALVARLLAFSRKQVLDAVPMDVDEVIRGFVGMLRPTMRADIEIHLDLQSSPACVRGDAAQLEQVILNLAINARDAMPNGGVVTVSTSVVRPGRDWVRRHPGCRAGPHVLLSVRDHGFGMSEATLSHLFEPFFTTKERGKGTGLGLATAYGIVQQHGGVIEVASSIGRGSEFQVFLPVHEGTAVPAGARPEVPAVPRGTETVLVVEDDDLVRGFACQVLDMHGYRAIPLETPEACLRHLAEGTEPAALLLTDIVLPGMDGRELGRRLAMLRPEVKILYMTGYSEDRNAGAEVAHPLNGPLSKPFTPVELLDRVRAVLDA